MSAGNTLIIDEAGQIAEAANCFVVIRDNTLKLVNCLQDAVNVVASYQAPQLLTLMVQFPHPIRRVQAEWTQNVPYPNVLKLEVQTQQAVLEVNSYGQDIDVKPLSQIEAEVELFLVNYYEIERRPTVSARVFGIIRHDIGDRISVFDRHQQIRAEITIDTIRYDFENQETEFAGKSVISHVWDA